MALRLVIYPYHAHLLKIIRITGHWPAFEAWKRAVVHIVAEEARNAGGESIPLWDFSGFNELTSEAVPPKSDRQTKMRWYWEAGHFKRELGDLILERIFDPTEATTGFGVLLDTSNIKEQIHAVQVQEVNYRRAFSQEIEELERFAADLQPRK